MSFATFEIAAGTPFFHGTDRSADVIKQGVKESTATPAGKGLTGYRWFFASFSPAEAYTGVGHGLPAVVEFKTTQALRFADLRDQNALPAGPGSQPNAQQLLTLGFDGIIIRNTSRGHDYEYGFASNASLTYVGYEPASDIWHIAEAGKQLFWAQPDEKVDTWHTLQKLKQKALRIEIEKALSSPSKP